MNSIIKSFVVAVMVVGLLTVNCAFAATLPVYKFSSAASSFVQVTDDSATALSSGAQGLGNSQNLKFTANVASSLQVNLSATQVDWAIQKSGTYQVPAIEITYTATSASPLYMKVDSAKKADNLKSAEGNEIETHYCVAAKSDTTMPDFPSLFQFNDNKHKINAAGSVLWNRLKVEDKTGIFSDEFTVNFSQTL